MESFGHRPNGNSLMTAEPSFNPVLLNIPDRIETPRLLLRAPRPGDGAMLNVSIIETLDDLREFPASLLWALEPQPVERAEEFCRRGAANWIVRADFPMLLFRRDTDEHVGNCGLHRFNWTTRVFEIGWWCRKRCQGQGLLTEAAAALTAFAFQHLGARRVWCCCDAENERSWRVAERLGFRYEGTHRSERCDPNGTRRDMRVYATTR
jgi:RimJ/RimL family protein N-acetyltransferase